MTLIRSLSGTLHFFVVVACLGLAGCTSMVTHFGGGLSEELQQNGTAAMARIQEVWDTGWTINDNPVIGMKVLVLPADRPAFTATIEKTTISRIATAQFQPGNTVPVRFDPKNPALAAVDFSGSAPAASSSGNPYRDRFEPTALLGANFLPAPASPELYLGTGDSAADVAALYENDYALLGASRVEHGSDLQQAREQGEAAGAALVVVYGHFVPPAGEPLELLPFRPRPAAPGAAAGTMPLVSSLGPDDQLAAYWGKTRPAILGIVSRPLNTDEQARLGRGDGKEGIFVESVANGSPAAEAGIAPGDVLVAIDGQPFADVTAVPALIGSMAGRRVAIDLLRGGRPFSVMVQLNPAAP